MMEDKVKRIISLAPSSTEILFFLGLRPKVVGVTDQCDWPEEVCRRTIEKVGSFSCPDMERIALLKPDLLIAYRGVHDRFLGEFNKRRIRVFLMSSTKVDGILEDMEKLGYLAGLPDLAEYKVGSLREKLKKIKEKIHEHSKFRVFRLMGDGPIFTPTIYCYQYDSICIAGGSPMSLNSPEAYAPVSLKDLTRFNPDIIISCGRKKDEQPKDICQGCIRENPICQRVIDDIRNWKGWGDIKAVNEGRIYSIPCEIICRPGPRILDGIERIAGFIRSATVDEDLSACGHAQAGIYGEKIPCLLR